MASGADRPGGERPSLGWQRTETLGLAEIAMTILEARQDVPSATAAAITRERHGDELYVQVTLLNDPPPDGTAPTVRGPAGTEPATTGPATTGPATTGPATTGPAGEVVAAFAVRRLGADLTEAFGEKDVIILK